MNELPEKTFELIEELWHTTGKSPKLLLKEYIEILNDPFLKIDPQFKTDEDRHSYARGVLRVRYEVIIPLKSVGLL